MTLLSQDGGDRSAKASLLELQSRLRSATGPDRALDIAIRDALLGPHPGDFRWIRDRGGPIEDVKIVEPYTASIDAALALVERVLPGTEFEITNLYGLGFCSVDLNDSKAGRSDSQQRRDGNIPLAILDALLSALISKSAEGAVTTSNSTSAP